MFVLESTLDGAGTIVKREVTGGPVADGQALKFSNGAVVKASGTDKPECISIQAQPGTGKEVETVAVREDQVWVTDCAGSQNRGEKYTINTDGGGITTTTASGVATVDSVDPVAKKCRVRFK